jgi:hypothetical protein
MVGATLVGFVAPTPGIVLAPGEVSSSLASSAAIYATPDPRQTQDTITFNVRALIGTLGPLLVWAIAGMVVLVARLREHPGARAAVAIPVFIGGYFLLASIPPRHYARNLLPILPFVAVAGGIAAATLFDQMRVRAAPNRMAAGAGTAIVVFALAVSLVPSAVASVALTVGLTRPDTRDIARAWMLANVPQATTIAREIYTPQFDDREYVLAGSFFLHEIGLDGYRDRGVHYLIASSWAYERFVDKAGTPDEDAFYRGLFALPEVFRVDPGPSRSGPTIRILRLDPVAGQATSAPASRSIARSSRSIVRSWPSATSVSNRGGVAVRPVTATRIAMNRSPAFQPRASASALSGGSSSSAS